MRFVVVDKTEILRISRSLQQVLVDGVGRIAGSFAIVHNDVATESAGKNEGEDAQHSRCNRHIAHNLVINTVVIAAAKDDEKKKDNVSRTE